MTDCEIFELLRDDVANRQANVDRLIADGYSVETITEMLDQIENLERQDAALPSFKSLLGMFKDNPIDLASGWDD